MSDLATVTAVSPLMVLLDSSDTATEASRLGSYPPALADRVAVLRQGSSLLVLGKVLSDG